PLRELSRGVQMREVRVHATAGEQSQQVQRPALADRGACRAQRGVLEERAVGDRVVDADELLVLHVAGAHREMAHLAVPHDAVRKSDRPAARLEPRVRVAREELVEPRRLGAGYRVARTAGGDPPSVEDAEDHRPVTSAHAKARTMFANSSALSDAPPTSAPSMPSAPANSAALAAVTLPP